MLITLWLLNVILYKLYVILIDFYGLLKKMYNFNYDYATEILKKTINAVKILLRC